MQKDFIMIKISLILYLIRVSKSNLKVPFKKHLLLSIVGNSFRYIDIFSWSLFHCPLLFSLFIQTTKIGLPNGVSVWFL